MDYKSEMCNELAIILSKQFDVPVQHFENIFYYVAQKYNIETSCTDLVTVDNSDIEIIKKFIVSKKLEGLSDRTLDYYGHTVKRFYNFLNHQKSIIDVTPDDIRAFLANGTINEKWSAINSNNIRRNLSAFYTWLFDEEYIPRNPVRKIKKIKTPKNVRVPFTETEIEKMRDCLEDTKVRNKGKEKVIRNRAIIEVLLSTGCRVGELCNMKIGDIDFRNKEIKVLGKGNKERIVFLNDKAAYHLKKYLDSRDKHREATDYVFYTLWETGEKCKPLNISGVEIVIRELGKACGVKAFPHKFRHTAATTALRRGMPIEQVRIMLGHDNIDTTLIYAQSNIDDVKLNHNKFMQ